MDALENGARTALESVRGRITELDRELIGLIAERVELAREASAWKEAVGLPETDPAREAQVVRQAANEARSQGIEPEVVRDIFWRLVGLSHWAQSEGAGGSDS